MDLRSSVSTANETDNWFTPLSYCLSRSDVDEYSLMRFCSGTLPIKTRTKSEVSLGPGGLDGRIRFGGRGSGNADYLLSLLGRRREDDNSAVKQKTCRSVR